MSRTSFGTPATSIAGYAETLLEDTSIRWAVGSAPVIDQHPPQRSASDRAVR